MKLQFDGDIISGPGGQIRADWPLADARLIEGRVVALGAFDEMGSDSLLASYRPDGQRIWKARLRGAPTDAVVSIDKEDPLEVHTWSGWICHVDIETGKVTEHVFAK